MSLSVSTTVDGVVVVTHVHPAPQGAGHQHCATLQKFSKSRPVVLGTVQIMIGLIILLFGIAMAFGADTVGVFTGIFVWGAAFYIIAGALTLAAGKYLTRSLVNAALALCVIAALASATATIFHSMDVAKGTSFCYDCGPWQQNCCSPEMLNNSKHSEQPGAPGLMEPPIYISIDG
ncbi:hypothetical protein F2P81_012180 [Scophthalmus maximus]|uniref:Membrane-spanning 4-domains subfamily A member 4A-like n=1 Tax=Scophthalmus maximus TaxID=52904 RepID=A0A6A4SWH1_SCOMX|nr:hypothetical protein F2P81_012180 [Scophthalmus maximus]